MIYRLVYRRFFVSGRKYLWVKRISHMNIKQNHGLTLFLLALSLWHHKVTDAENSCNRLWAACLEMVHQTKRVVLKMVTSLEETYAWIIKNLLLRRVVRIIDLLPLFSWSSIISSFDSACSRKNGAMRYILRSFFFSVSGRVVRVVVIFYKDRF